ncbi:MAG: hypothetical protein HFJ51_03035 [Clostridia bacterium]|nr:hypothetical protein [Clostridia bacterium]
MKKIDLDQICDKWEAENKQRQIEIFKKVIDEYSKLCNVDFRKENKLAHNDYEVFDCLFQLTVAQPQFFEEFHNILNKYGFNDKTYLDYLIKKVTKNASNLNAFINGLIDVGMINEIYDIENHSVNIESFLGKYNFFSANEYYIDNKEVKDYIQNGNLNRNCHLNTLFLLKGLKKGEAVTAKCSSMFNNLYYHSYYRCDGIISDLNINCVMQEKDYNKIYNPQIISVVNIDNLEEKQNKVKNDCESTLVDLLEIAVYEEILNKNTL